MTNKNFILKGVITVVTCLILLSNESANAQTPYNYSTNATQTYQVPAGVTSLYVQLWAAGGGSGYYTGGAVPMTGGSGAYISGILSGLTPGSTITLYVPSGGGYSTSSAGAGGWPGGGAGASDAAYGEYAGGGGGYAAIAIGGTYFVVAGGGGGGGSSTADASDYGGGGGATSGTNGGDGLGGSGSKGGYGGTVSAGGVAGTPAGSAKAGTSLQGGVGGTANADYGGGGGGGGYFGGGGGNEGGGGGGGGSSYPVSTVTSGGVTFTVTSVLQGSINTSEGTASAPGSPSPSTIGAGNYGAAGGAGQIIICPVTSTPISITGTPTSSTAADLSWAAGTNPGTSYNWYVSTTDSCSTSSSTQTVTFSDPGTQTWTCPAGVTSINVQCWGGGGSGGGAYASSTPAAGSGGAGGSFAQGTNISVTPGTVYTVVVGAGGLGISDAAGATGGSSSFNTSTVIAVGGTGGKVGTNTYGGSVAGTTTGDAGTAPYYAGGTGAAGTTSPTGGGGGGGAGTTGAGGNASGTTGGNGGTSGGGAGAIGTSGTTIGLSGNPGTAPGGGGSGGETDFNESVSGGNGGNGQVIITYNTGIISSGTTTSTSASVSGLAAGTTYYLNVTSSGSCSPSAVGSVSFTTPEPCTSPASQVVSESFSNITGTTATITFTRPSTIGTGGVIIVGQASSPTSINPAYTSTYTASTIFGSGSPVGSAYVVYNDNTVAAGGTGTVTITGLSINTTYYFTAYEYNATGPCYLVPGLSNSFTTTGCVTPASPVSVTGTPTSGTTANLSWAAGSPAGDPTVTYNWYVNTDGITTCSTVATVVTSITATGSDQTFTVPPSVSSINVQVWGAGGGGGEFNGTDKSGGGSGGYVSGTLAVTPGSTLTVVVGNGGVTKSTATVYGGGGGSGSSAQDAASGGGRSAIQLTAGTDAVTAGGGGGAGSAEKNTSGSSLTNQGYGGNGGSTTGGSSLASDNCTAATGGTQLAGGSGGVGGSGTGGAGSTTAYTGGVGSSSGDGGGGGGGGYFGGGGGGGPSTAVGGNGGGGGSSYVANLTGTVVNDIGTAGSTTEPFTTTNYVSGVGVGGTAGTGAGGPGLVVITYNTGYQLGFSGSTTSTSVPITGLTCGTTYYLNVNATTGCNSTTSSCVTSSGFTPSCCTPTAPSSLTASANGSSTSPVYNIYNSTVTLSQTTVTGSGNNCGAWIYAWTDGSGNYWNGSSFSLSSPSYSASYSTITPIITANTTYTCSVTGTGNSTALATSSITVDIVTLPTITAEADNNSGSETIAAGLASVLTANPSGGSGCAGTIEYAWSNNGGAANSFWNGTDFTGASAAATYSSSYSTITTPTLSSTTTFTCYEECSTTTNSALTSAVTVNIGSCSAPTLTAEANSSTGTVIVGSSASVTLTANASGGNYCNGGSAWAYAWSNDGGTTFWNGTSFSGGANYNTSYGSISYTTGGSNNTTTYTVYAQCSSNSGCASTASSVAVQTLVTCATPAITAEANGTSGSYSIIYNTALTLTANPVGGGANCSGTFQYAWSNDGGTTFWNGSAFSGGANYDPSYTSISLGNVTAGGTYTAYVQCSSNTSCNNTSSVIVSVGSCSAPALTAKANGTASTLAACAGTSITLTANASGGAFCNGNYAWSNDGGTTFWNGTAFSGGANYNSAYSSIAFTLSSSNTYTCYVQCTSPSCNNSSAVTVNITAPSAPVLASTGGTQQLAFNNAYINTTQPYFREAATNSCGNYNTFYIDINTNSTFTGTDYSQTYSGTYASATALNFQFTNGIPSTAGVTYYVRVKAAADGGTNWSAWSGGTYSFTYNSTAGNPDWLQQTQPQFSTGTLSGVTSNVNYVALTSTAGGGNIFINPSFETTAAVPSCGCSAPTSWTKEGFITNGGYASDQFGWINTSTIDATAGSSSLRFWNDGPLYECTSEAFEANDFLEVYQQVNLTGISSISFDEAFIGICENNPCGDAASSTTFYLIIDSTNSTSNYLAGADYAANTNSCTCSSSGANGPTTYTVSGLTFHGNCTVRLVAYVNTTVLSAGAAPTYYVDNIIGDASPSGTITSPTINMSSVQGATKWNNLYWNQTQNGGTITLAVQQYISGAWTTVSGFGAITSATDGANTFSLSGLASTIDSIRIVATLGATSGAALSPALNSWSADFVVPTCMNGPVYTVGPGYDYSNITAAFSALSTNLVCANLVFELQPTYVSTSETYPLTLNALNYGAGGPFNVTFRPSAAVSSSLTTSGSPASVALIDLSGTDHIIFDGRPDGSGANKYWTIQNTASGGSYPAILYINGATNDTLEYLNIQSSGTSTLSSSTIVYSTSTVSGGNSNNDIQYCNIGNYSASPYGAIYSLGTASADANSSNTIQNNNIYNFQGYTAGTPTPTNGGVIIAGTGNGSGWKINGNSFYSTSTTTGSYLTCIDFEPGTTSSGDSIYGNYIGGQSAGCGGSPWVFDGYRDYSNYTDFTGIYVNAGGPVVAQNTIQNIKLMYTETQTFSGITVNTQSGATATISNNMIGSYSTANSIVVGNYGEMLGIYNEGVGTVNILNDTIANLTSNGSASPSGTTTSGLCGIYVLGNGTNKISNNLIFNLSTATSYNNNLYFYTVAGGGGSNGTAGGASTENLGSYWMMVTGIYLPSALNSATQIISHNTIYGLNSSVTSSSYRNYFTGIIDDASGTGATVDIDGNNIYGFYAPSNFGSTPGTYYAGFTGIYLGNTAAATHNVTNNVIDLGTNLSGASVINASVRGIWDNSDYNNTTLGMNFYYNSVYIGGTDASTTLYSMAFSRDFDYSSTEYDKVDIKNNIFENNRSSTSTAYNYGIYLNQYNNPPVDLTSNYNLVYGTGTGFQFGLAGNNSTTVNYATQSAWNGTTALDANTLTSNPQYDNATSIPPNLDIPGTSPAIGMGTSSLNITVSYDFDSVTRTATEDMGAYVIPATPNITTTGTLSAFSTTYGTASAHQSFTASGTALTANITITAPTGFLVSTSPTSGYSTSVTLTESGGSVGTTTIYVELAATSAAGTYSSEEITLSSTGATTVDVTIPSSTVNPAALTITANSTSKCFGQTVTFAGTEFTNGTLFNSDNVTSVTITSTGASSGASVGGSPYSIVPSAATGSGLSNYSITYDDGSLTVNALPSPTFTTAPSPVCNGVTDNVYTTQSGQSNYLWNITGGTITAGGGTGDNTATVTWTSSGSESISVNYTNSNSCTAASPTSQSVTVNTCGGGPVTWLGGTNDWSTSTNWSGGVVPNSCAVDILIPSGTNFPPVISSSSIYVGNVTIDAGVTLTLSGQNMNVCGNWTGGSGSHAAVVGSGIVFINSSTGAQTISGNTQFSILQIDNTSGVSLTSGAIAAISTGLHLQAGAFNASAGTVHLLSTAANNNSYIDDFTSGFAGTLTGTIIADRYVPVTGYNQHFISSPVSSASLQQLNASGPDGSYVTPMPDCDEYQSQTGSAYGSVFIYNDGHEQSGGCMLGNWQIKSSGNMSNGLGYSTYLTGNQTLSLTGAANTGDLSIGNLNNSGYPTVNTLQGDPIESGWNLVGNPYPSAISLSTSRDEAGFQNQILLWVTDGPFSGSWQYAVIDSPAENAVTVAPFQAFMVRVKPGSTGIHSYPFYQSERVRTTNVSFYRTQLANTLDLNLNYNGMTDVTTVSFKPNATNGFDDAYDANKQDGAQGRPTLYTTMNDNHWYALNNLPSLTQVATVPMGLHPEVSGTMTITPQGIESFDPTTYVYLEDKQTSTWHNLRDGAYTFAANATDNQDRFVLHFTPPAEILTRSANCNTTGLITISQPGTANWSFVITDASNDIIATGTLNQANQVTVDANAGVYTVTLKDTAGYTVVKNIQVGGSAAIVAAFTSSATSAQTSEAVSFNSSADNSAIYNWNFGDGSTATGQDVTHDFTTPGVYTVQLTVTNTSGCVSTTTRVITVTSRSTTGITNINANGNISIWSNENRVYVDFSKETSVDAQVDIYNVLGQLLSSEKFGKSDIYSKEIDNLEAAYLIIRVNNENEVTTKKVFIANVNK